MAIIFDLDGVLINSEPYWQQAETEVFRQCGLDFTLDMAKQTTGMRCDRVVDYWFTRQPWQIISRKQAELMIIERVTELICTSNIAMPYAEYALEQANQFTNKVALATSTANSIMHAIIDNMGWQGYFQELVSAEHLSHPKPHPDVYLLAAKKLGTDPQRCIAVEDSLTGMLAAKSANMQLIAIPERQQKGMEIADITLTSLQQVNQPLFYNLINR